MGKLLFIHLKKLIVIIEYDQVMPLLTPGCCHKKVGILFLENESIYYIYLTKCINIKQNVNWICCKNDVNIKIKLKMK